MPEYGLLDTSVVAVLSMINPGDLPARMVISAVTLAELSAGPHHSKDPVERARRTSVLQHVEATFDPLPFDADAARAYGLVSAAAWAAGRSHRSRFADLMIASVAVANRLPLYTINVQDFVVLGNLLSIVPVTRPAGAP